MLIEWTHRLLGKSTHPLADAARAAELMKELPRDNPAQALVDAAAWLDAIESEPSFDLAHRLNVVSIVDEGARRAVEQLTLAYAGVLPRLPSGRIQDWRTLSEYLEKLSSAYAGALDAYAALPKLDEPRLALFATRAMRVIIDKMRTGWVRYLPPDRASWEHMVACYQLASRRKVATTLVKAYASDIVNTCAAYELAAAAMLTAAVPQSLSPSQIDVTCRLALQYAGAFMRSSAQEADSIMYVDLEKPAAPTLIRAQQPAGRSLLYFGPGTVAVKLAPLLDETNEQRTALLNQLGSEISAQDKLTAVEHALRFWSTTPPSRREPRTRINTPVQALVGVGALQRALGHLAHVPDDARLKSASSTQPTVHTWTLTDFSTHGIGARFTRRPDGALSVGSVIGFRLERSPQWAIGIVRRLRNDRQNQTDVGIEILAKATELVALEAWDPRASLSSIVSVRSGAVLLPDNPQLQNRASMLLEPGTYNPADTFILHRGTGARRARLAATTESLDGWNRVELEWLDSEKADATAAAEAI